MAATNRNDTADLRLLLNQLKQLNGVDHMAYRWWDYFEWFPTKEDEEEAEKIPKEKRTEKQNKILEQKEDRIYEEYCKNQRERRRSEYELHMVKSGLKPDKKTYW
jgi:hypothetical protein